ncbi:MAG: hypothetical protein EZS28_015737 [Streblomastix strix]|uniref:KilA-N domain-containing protein n=1 Tax=Streblomastix strix TaxID=222440 RepID=A0A5J4W2K1_9EUKA|nr:MAG: hypothetical protein EZS28_015737 [Streblomastix strix]
MGTQFTMEKMEQVKTATEIQNNEQFKIVSYNRLNIMIQQSNGFVNATKLCDQHHKPFRHLMRIQFWHDYFDQEQQKLECGGNQPYHLMYEINKGFDNKFNGYYVHPNLINYVAIWVSPKYAVTIRKITDKINETTIAEHEADKTQAITDQFYSVINTVNDTLSDRITELNNEVRQLAPRAVPNGKERTYILIVEEVNEDEQLEEQQEDHITIRIRRINRNDLRPVKIERYRRESLLFVDNLPIVMTINEKIKETLLLRQDVKIWSTHYTFPKDQLDFIIDIIQAVINTERAH